MRVKIPLITILSTVLLTACSSTSVHLDRPPALNPLQADLRAEQADWGWWQLRFKLHWPEHEEPDFSTHLLIAEQIMLPALVEYQDKLALWRFHRRAARDDAGNQFSLIFYSDDATARALNRRIITSALTLRLLRTPIIERTTFSKRTRQELGRLEETSDADWPPQLQRAWPYFIMGASQSWLMLVKELSQESMPTQPELSLEELLRHYQQVEQKLNLQWQEFGQHAYLHHLSALFGYHPLRIRGPAFRRF